MKRMMITAVLIACLLVPATGFAFPFVEYDPQAGVTFYKLTGAAWLPATIPARADGSVKIDVAESPVGASTIAAAACVSDPIWGELCAAPTPFGYTRPGSPAAAKNPRLTATP